MQRKPPVPPPATNSSQIANAYQANANIPSFNMPSAYQVPPAVPSFGQLTSGPIPPPPFPPIPANPQEFPEQAPPFSTGSRPNSSHAFPPQHRSAQANNIGRTANIDRLMIPMDKEEGELSDRDMERKSSSSGQDAGIVVPQPTRSGTIDNRAAEAGGIWNQKAQKRKSPVTKARDLRKITHQNKPATSSARVPSGPRAYDSYTSNRHANPPKGNSYSPLENRRYDQYIPERRDNGPSYLQRSISPPNAHERKKATVNVPSASPHNHVSSQQCHDNKPATPLSSSHYSPTAGKPYSEIRNLAKNALLNLIPLKVEYKDFINEGINEEVVKGLFEELRLRIPNAAPTQRIEESSHKHTPFPHAPQLTESNTSPARSSMSQGTQSLRTLTASDAPPPPQRQTSAEISKARGSADNENAPIPPTKKALLASVATGTGVQLANDGSVGPKLSRAELIKQRFAERENKKAKMAAPVEEAKPHGLPDPMSDREKELAAEKEKKVKNELIKQRMEALKKSASLKGTGPPSAGNADTGKTTDQPRTLANGSVPQEIPLIKQQAQAPAAAAGANVPFTGIPGLFMTSSSAPSNDASSNSNQDPTPPPQVHGTNRRKRPVAADFEDTPTPPASSFKRPFGRSRVERPLVIEVSDDDTANGDDDTDMDIDDDDGPDSDRQQRHAQPSQGRNAIRDFPPLPDFPNKRRPGTWGSAPVSAMSTPPLSKDSPFSYPNGRGKSSAQEDLKRKYEQIQLMQKKIAELELKKAKPGTSRGQTPGTPGRSAQPAKKDQTPKTSEKTEAAEAAAAAAEIDRLIEDANRQVNVDKLELAEAKAANLKNVEQDGTAEAESEHQKRLRLAEIEYGIPLIDAEVEKSRSKVEELRAETAKWEAAVREGLEGKRKLIEEMEMLKIKESKNQVEIQTNESEREELGESPRRDSHSVNRESDRPKERRTHSVAMTTAVSDATDGPSHIETTQEPKDMSNELVTTAHAGLITEADLSLQEASMKTTSNTNPTPPSRSSDAMDIEMGSAEDSEMNVRTEAHTDVLLVEGPSDPIAEIIEAASCAPVANVEAIADTNEVADAEMEDADAVDLNRQSIVDDSEATSNQEDKPLATGNGSDKEEGPPDGSRESSDESDFYEPPEATHSPFHERASSASNQASPNVTSPTNQATADAQTQLAVPEPTAEPAIEKPGYEEYFTPYDSPLKQFRAYRYHRNYLKDVPGGFRSLTYSHNIDPNKPLCMFETSGVCNDTGCQDQHFRDMKLNDDMVLVHLGSVNEGHDAEEKAQYTEGLKQIIQNMRNQKVKDFSTVASQITGYRSRFLKDESRVLILDLQNQQRKSPGTQTGGT
ncbi:hypothetical protein FGG08_005206 [Glutinoglossum americanum]|uniref:Putative zinc-finger domain-containing protein n=1 Tax=Glutinoglossum americanum TaxID=1670608 RepID=A0A9P8I431_9PEZI|nr:hypothetical protein FGG08_005206 [Glutinoglossum americanum]